MPPHRCWMFSAPSPPDFIRIQAAKQLLGLIQGLSRLSPRVIHCCMYHSHAALLLPLLLYCWTAGLSEHHRPVWSCAFTAWILLNHIHVKVWWEAAPRQRSCTSLPTSHSSLLSPAISRIFSGFLFTDTACFVVLEHCSHIPRKELASLFLHSHLDDRSLPQHLQLAETVNHCAAFESWHCACAGLQPKPIHVSVSGREQHQSDKRPLRQASSHQVNFLSSNRKPQNCITTTTTSLSSNVTQQKKDCQQEEKVSGIHAQPILSEWVHSYL